MYKKFQCPQCQHSFFRTGLRQEASATAPRRFGLHWPRSYCPQCGVQLRSSNRSLLGATVLFIAAMVLQILGLIYPEWRELAKSAGFICLLMSLICLVVFQRWVVVR